MFLVKVLLLSLAATFLFLPRLHSSRLFHRSALVENISCEYTLSNAGTPSVNGCYSVAGEYEGSPLYRQKQQHGSRNGAYTRGDTLWELFRYQNEWRLGVAGVVALYSATCESQHPPSQDHWMVFSPNAAKSPPPTVVGSASTPVGACSLPPAPTKNCSCAACQKMWGHQFNGSCPDLHVVQPDLVRPQMLSNGTRPRAGLRVQLVAPSFSGTQAYHALYLPIEWEPASAGDDQKKYPVIVEYMGNGPWNDSMGDSSSGRPEDSNLGYGIGAGGLSVRPCLLRRTRVLPNTTVPRVPRLSKVCAFLPFSSLVLLGRNLHLDIDAIFNKRSWPSH